MADHLRLLSFVAVIGGVFATIALLASTGTITLDQARSVVEDDVRGPVRELGVLGPVLFVVVGVLAVLLLAPGPVLCASGGFVFGTAIGLPTVLVTLLIGGCLAFAVARWWAHDAVGRLGGPRVQRLRGWIARRGFVAIMLARTPPGVPFSLVSYASGLTPVRLATFAAATMVGCFPRTTAYVALGGSFGDLRAPEAIAALTLLVLVGLVGMSLLARDLRGAAREA